MHRHNHDDHLCRGELGGQMARGVGLALSVQWSHRMPSASSSGWRQPRQLTFFFANRMMLAPAIDGVEIAIERVCSPARGHCTVPDRCRRLPGCHSHQ